MSFNAGFCASMLSGKRQVGVSEDWRFAFSCWRRQAVLSETKALHMVAKPMKIGQVNWSKIRTGHKEDDLTEKLWTQF